MGKVMDRFGAISQRTLGERLALSARPAVEAILLAAVALGCAQAGWSILTPSSAGALGAAGDDQTPSRDMTIAQSPFAPHAMDGSARSHAVSALLSSVQLSGIRMADDPDRSGAMFTMSDGGQRAFMVGQEVADGVTLSDVEADYVLLTYGSSQHRLDMTAPSGFSFARAMMGMDQQAAAPPPNAVAASAPAAAADLTSATQDGASAPPESAFAVGGAESADAGGESSAPAAPAAGAEFSEADRSWLASTLAHVEMGEDRAVGWRIEEPAPEAVLAAGLLPGDLVVSVNNAGPNDLVAALAAAQSGQVTLEVQRDDTRLSLALNAAP